jgi:cellulose synthase operon protein C
MRVFNVRLAAILLAVVVVFGVGVFFLHGYQVQRNADFFLDEAKKARERAQEAAKNKDTEAERQATKEALEYLHWHVNLMPNDADSLEQLGNMLADQSCQGEIVLDRRTFFMAMDYLDTAVRLEPERSDARRRLAKMSIKRGRFHDAKQHLEEYLLKQLPKDSELLALLGQCLAETGDTKSAQKKFQEAIAADSKQVTAYVQLAELLRSRLDKPQEADDWMAKMVAANPQSYKAHYLRSVYLGNPRVGQFDEAIKEVTDALKLAPDDAGVLLLASRYYDAKKQHDKARQCAAHGIELYPTNISMYLALADVETHAGNRDKAIAVYEQGLKATNRNPVLLGQLGNLLVDVKKLEDAKKIIEELRKVPSARVAADFIEARVEFVQNNWVRAVQCFESVRGPMVAQRQVLKQIDFWLSICYEQLEDRDKQEQALDRVLQVDPSFGPAREAKLLLQMRKGEIDPDTVESLRKSSRGSPGSIEVAQARIQLFKTMRVPPSERDWRAVERAIRAAEKAAPANPEVPMMRADVFIQQSRFNEAENLLLKIRKGNPKQPQVWSMLLVLAEQQKDWKRAEELLKEAKEAMGDGVEYRLVEARHLAQRKGEKAAERLRKLAENTDKLTESARLSLWKGLMNAALQVGDPEQATSLGQKIAQKQRTNVQIRHLLLDIAVSTGKEDVVKTALDQIEGIAGKDAYWLYGKAILLDIQSQKAKDPTPMLNQALDYLDQASKQRKDWGKISLIEAAIYDRMGKPDLALRCHREAVELGERNPTAILRLVQLLYQRRQIVEAEQLLRRLEGEGVALSPLLLRLLAETALQQGQADRALELTKKAVSPDSKDYKDYLWLGRMLGLLGLHAKFQGQGNREVGELFTNAERSLRRAVELAPKAPDAWLPLVRFLATVGDERKVDAAIRDAGANVDPKDAPLTLARCYEAANRAEKAQEQYEQALRAAPQDITVLRAVGDFYRRTGKLLLAETALLKILDGKVKGTPSDIVWARRQLASVYIARRDYKSLKKAQALIEQNMASPEASVVERSLLAKMKAFDPDVNQRKEAKAILKDLIDRDLASPEDVIEFAEMLAAGGDWAEASGLYRDLLASQSRDPRHLVAYVAALLKHDEVSNAEVYLQRLEKVAANAFNTASLKADVFCAMNKPQEAFELLDGFVDKANATPRDRPTRMRMVADKLDRLGRQLTKPDQASLAAKFASSAESLYRTYVGENPGQDLVLAVFLGTRTKIDEALSILDRSQKTANVEEFCQACLLIVQGGKASKEQLQHIDRLLQAATKQHDKSVLPLLVTADLRTFQGQYAEAASNYRKVLEKAPDNHVALNNLAVLQALQGVNLEESLKLVNQAIEIAGPQGAMLDSRATVYTAMKDAQKALDDIKAAVADQETPVRLFHLAQAYELAGDMKAARETFDKAQRTGFTKELLQPLEVPAYERLRQLLR